MANESIDFRISTDKRYIDLNQNNNMLINNVPYDYDHHAVSFKNIRKILGSLEYGHPRRLGFALLALTGIRVSVMVNIGSRNFDGNIVTFKPGKNQKGRPRRCSLPHWFMKELQHYLSNNPYRPEKFFPYSSNSFQREWNKLRHKLGAPFNIKKPVFAGWRKHEYLIQIKGIRKTYMTKLYWDLVPKYGMEGAVHVVAAEMRHSSVMITMAHYLKELENPEIYNELNKYRHTHIHKLVHAPSQETIQQDHIMKSKIQKSLLQYDEGASRANRLKFNTPNDINIMEQSSFEISDFKFHHK